MFCFTPSGALKSLTLIALACFASFTFAAEPGAGASSEYRLSVEKSAAFRGAAKEPAIPALESRKETPIAARFADRPYAKLIDVAARDAALDPIDGVDVRVARVAEGLHPFGDATSASIVSGEHKLEATVEQLHQIA